ncbi:MAG: ABC transporter permease [Desulfomonile tiedjei]|nr:ABC transporter permease [Desulfomonile tiedjei]
MKLVLGLIPFAILVGGYFMASHVRLDSNPDDKLTPSASKMVEAVHTMAFTRDTRTGRFLMLTDTLASVRRIVIGLGLASVVGLILGMDSGAFPGISATLMPVIRFLSIVPPLAVLPILFVVFGVGELGKVMLIFLGSVFVITRDVQQETEQIPKEQIVKALTLGASQMQVLYTVLLPQIMPRLLIAVRLSLGAAWLFLIASEAIASTDGLGYRIFLMRRYLAMDVIIPYVLWITFLGFCMDALLRLVVSWKYRWFVASQ